MKNGKCFLWFLGGMIITMIGLFVYSLVTGKFKKGGRRYGSQTAQTPSTDLPPTAMIKTDVRTTY